MIERGELADVTWAQIALLMPENRRRGGRWRDHRTVVNGILWKLYAPGLLGATCPSATAPGRPAIEKLRPLAQGRHLGTAAGRCPNQERRGRRGRVAAQRRQHPRPGAPACRGCPPKAEQARRKKGVLHPVDEVLGRSRGGLTTKLHLSCDGKGGGPSRSWSRPDNARRAPSWRRCSTRSGWRAPAADGRANAPSACSPTEATAILAAGSCCVLAASHTSSPSARTSSAGAGRRSSIARPIPRAQRGGEVREPAQAVAGGRNALREAGGQLPGDGGHRCADDLVVLVNRQTRPRASSQGGRRRAALRGRGDKSRKRRAARYAARAQENTVAGTVLDPPGVPARDRARTVPR